MAIDYRKLGIDSKTLATALCELLAQIARTHTRMNKIARRYHLAPIESEVVTMGADWCWCELSRCLVLDPQCDLSDDTANFRASM